VKAASNLIVATLALALLKGALNLLARLAAERALERTPEEIGELLWLRRN
jgi:hypothetical protein